MTLTKFLYSVLHFRKVLYKSVIILLITILCFELTDASVWLIQQLIPDFYWDTLAFPWRSVE